MDSEREARRPGQGPAREGAVDAGKPNAAAGVSTRESGAAAADAVAFLTRWPTRRWLLTAIHPETRAIEAETFLAERADDAADWIGRRLGHRNLYFAVNPPERPMSKKPTKADVGRAVALHVDVDPRPGAGIAAERDRILTALKAHPKAPSVIVDSGGGYQAFWLLAEPTDDLDAVEARNLAIAAALGGDRCHNVDRVMRLPGTVNLPDEKKRAKGRAAAPAKVVEADWDRRYSLAEFEPPAQGHAKANPKAPGVDAGRLPISARMRKLIEGVDDPRHRYASRSEKVFAVITAMATAGCADRQIEAVFLDASRPIAAHVLEQPKPLEYLRRQIEKARAAAADPEVEELNGLHALVLIGDKAAVMKLSPEGPTFMSVNAFRQWHGNRFVARGKRTVTLAEHWLSSPARRQYEGLVFAPGREAPGRYNLWRGFAVEPKPGDCSKFLAHLRDNVCRGDEELFRWAVGWFAEIFQHPDRKSGTSLAIRGKQGTGKTKVGEVVGSLLGDHYVAVADPRYVVGHFNAHLASCLLLHADEGFWAGDHAAEGKLKDLVTGDAHFIEFKGKEPIRVRNFVRLLVTGNPEWVVPAGMEERRFAVLDIGDARKEDHAYFAAIDDEIKGGGRAALLDHLLGFDLRSVNLRSIPRTAALLDQKLASLTPEQGWWLDVLGSGRLPGGDGAKCPRAAMFDHYARRARDTGVKRRAIETRLGIFLERNAPGLRKLETDYEFPALKECRAAFARRIEHDIAWDDPEAGWAAKPNWDDRGAGEF